MKSENTHRRRRNRRSNSRQGRHSQKKAPTAEQINRISDHFTKAQLTCKTSGKFKISLGLVGALEALYSEIKQPIDIVKGFECPDIAEKRGALKRNYHTQGLAADIRVETLSLTDLFLAAECIDCITGIGLNKADNYIHIDTRKADRLCWIETKQGDIELTKTNRSAYIGPAHT